MMSLRISMFYNRFVCILHFSKTTNFKRNLYLLYFCYFLSTGFFYFRIMDNKSHNISNVSILTSFIMKTMITPIDFQSLITYVK